MTRNGGSRSAYHMSANDGYVNVLPIHFEAGGYSRSHRFREGTLMKQLEDNLTARTHTAAQHDVARREAARLVTASSLLDDLPRLEDGTEVAGKHR